MRTIFIIFLIPIFIFACSSKKEAVRKTVFNAETLFQQANEKIKKKRFEEAREILKEIKVKDTTGKYSVVAEIRIGDSYFTEGLFEEAAVEYGHFLKVHSHHTYAPYAQYQLGMTYFKKIKTVDVSYSLALLALDEFEKLLKNYPRNRYVSIVENRVKTCKNILAEYEFYVGDFYFKKSSYRAAAGRFRRLLEDYPDSRKEPEALYYLGVSYMNLGDNEQAVKSFTNLIEKYPATNVSREAGGLISSLQKEEQ
jgi:outer membrane protein assembly factor BamD